jgi:hypothetical protein
MKDADMEKPGKKFDLTTTFHLLKDQNIFTFVLTTLA